MRIIAFIEDDRIIRKILKHLGLWENHNHHNHDPPAHDFPHIANDLTYDDSYSQIPPSDYWFE